MSGNGTVEGFPVCEAAEVEGGAPAVFIKISGEIIVAGREPEVSI